VKRPWRVLVWLSWSWGRGGRPKHLLHLARVFSSKDNHLLLGEVNGHGGGGGHTSSESVCWESASVIDDIVRVECLQLLASRSDKHVSHEKSMVCTSADDSDIDSVPLVPSCISINDVDSIPCVEVVDGTFSVDFPDLS
jgi:hypothetical protein